MKTVSLLPQRSILGKSFTSHDHTPDIVRAMSEAIRLVSAGKHDPHKAHERIKDFYGWHEISQRTELVYESVMKSPPYDFWTRMHRSVTTVFLSPAD